MWAEKESTISDEEFEDWFEHWMADIYKTDLIGFKDSMAEWKRKYPPKFPSRKSDEFLATPMVPRD